MPPVRKIDLRPDTEVFRFEIPPILLKQFQESPRMVIKWRPDGIWPVPPEWFTKIDFWRELAANKEFNENYEIVIMPR